MRAKLGDQPALGRSTTAVGRAAEDLAATWLLDRGLTIVGRNVRVGALEIDLVARDGDAVVVVEVRARGRGAWQGPLHSLSARKRELLRRAGEALWQRDYAADQAIRTLRFDVVGVDLSTEPPTVEHVRAAL
jgi:putative endonuclease